MENKKILSITGLCKSFETEKKIKTQVLQDISFDVEKGDFIAIMGHSGSGKSTLLYNISGMDRPSNGIIIVDGEDISKLDEDGLADVRLHKFGYVFQQPRLLKTLTVEENIMLASSVLNREGKEKLKQKCKKLMEKVGIADLAGRDISTLSGGQAQRVSICRSIMNDPKIIFADEPTGALNSKTSDEVMDLFVGMNKEGSTIMLVTHDSKVAAKARQVWFLLDGHISKKVILGNWNQKSDSLQERQLMVNDIITKLKV